MPCNLLTNSLCQDMLQSVILAEHFGLVTGPASAKEGDKGELVDGSSGVRLGAYEGGERTRSTVEKQGMWRGRVGGGAGSI